ncbi:hypothetical protein AA09_22205 [Salmonella enterica subsp. enterica serovar Typhi str. STH2370]|nr:hypothetical protein AA09_22205 [Salmonella enterica subsp. enterica serovar Typhi str. STH2370]
MMDSRRDINAGKTLMINKFKISSSQNAATAVSKD